MMVGGFGSAIAGLLQVVVLVSIAPLVVGFLRLVKARIQLRAGPPLLQPYAELLKLLVRKHGVSPKSTSWVFTAAPGIAFGCYALLGWAAPPLYLGFIPLDLVAVVYLLAFARFVVALAGLDTGTSFGGMGSSREMFLNILIESALVVIAFALTMHMHSSNLSDILAGSSWAWLKNIFTGIALCCVLVALASTGLIEAGRMPVDNSASNMELGMIEQASHLAYSGRGLALLEWGEAIKLTFYLLLLGDLLIPGATLGIVRFTTIPALVALCLMRLTLGVVMLGLFELFQVKLPLRRIIVPSALAIVLGIVAIVMVSMATISGM